MAGYQTFYLPDEMTKFLEGHPNYKRSEFLRIIVMKAMLEPMSEYELEYYDDLVHDMKRKGFDRIVEKHKPCTPIENKPIIENIQPVIQEKPVVQVPTVTKANTKKKRPVIVSDNNY